MQVNTPIGGERKPERHVLRGRRENACILRPDLEKSRNLSAYHIVGVEMESVQDRNSREQVMSLHQISKLCAHCLICSPKYSQGMGQI